MHELPKLSINAPDPLGFTQHLATQTHNMLFDLVAPSISMHTQRHAAR
jgi:hypothetical protein